MIPEPQTSIRYEIHTPSGTFYTPSLANAQRYIRCFQRNHPGAKVSAVEINEVRVDLAIETTRRKVKTKGKRKGKVL